MLCSVFFALVFSCCHPAGAQSTDAKPVQPSTPDLHLTEHDVLETHGVSVLLFHNEYHRVFGDQKMNGMEIILHDQRIATGGDVRLSATPEQWDPIPDFKERKRIAPDEVAATCTYTDRGLSREDFESPCRWNSGYPLRSRARQDSIWSSCRLYISGSRIGWTTRPGSSPVIQTARCRRYRMEPLSRCRLPQVIGSFCRPRIPQRA